MTIRLVQELKLHIACCPCLGGKSLSTQIYIAAILCQLFRAQSMAKDAHNVALDWVIFISSSHVLDTVVCNFTAYHFEIKKHQVILIDKIIFIYSMPHVHVIHTKLGHPPCYSSRTLDSWHLSCPTQFRLQTNVMANVKFSISTIVVQFTKQHLIQKRI